MRNPPKRLDRRPAEAGSLASSEPANTAGPQPRAKSRAQQPARRKPLTAPPAPGPRAQTSPSARQYGPVAAGHPKRSAGKTSSLPKSPAASTRRPASGRAQLELPNEGRAQAKEQQTGNSNHRSSTNAIRLHGSLIQQSASRSSQPVPKVIRYVYQPLVVHPNSIGGGAGSGAGASPGAPAAAAEPRQVLKVGSEKTNGPPVASVTPESRPSESIESENDHAARWNDVLQHLNLAA